MGNAAVTRRLAAIVIADVVGYSRLMERDDTGTFSRLRSIRDEVVDPAIVSHDGRIVKTAGDGFLAEFPSALAALRASVQIQREMAKRNEGVSAEDRIDYRIGINLGDVMADKDDIAGDGVNVASRLESLAEPGGICASGSVREQVHGQMAVTFEDIGEQQVKNIERPIRVYRVAGAEVGAAARRRAVLRPRALGTSTGKRAAWMVGGIVGAMVVAWVVYTGERDDETASGPPALSVAVEPLAVSGGAPDAVARATSLTRDVEALLARSDVAIRVIPATTRRPGADRRSVRQAAKEANVRYVLAGDLQDQQGVSEIRLALTDGNSGAQVWTGTTSLPETATTVQRKQALRATVERLRSRLFSLEMQRVTTQPDGGSSAAEDVLRAAALDGGNTTLDVLRRQEALYERALAKDPNYVPALLGLQAALDGQLDLDAHVDRDRLVARMDDATRRAVSVNPAWPEIWSTRSSALMSLGQWQAALEASDRAIQLDPDAAWLVVAKALLTSLAGRPADALVLVRHAAEMDPLPTGRPMRVACEAQMLLGQYDQAADSCEKALGRGAGEFEVAYFLAAVYGHLGKTNQASAEAAKILRASPGFTIEGLRAKKYSVQPDYLQLAEQHWYPGLRKAGIPEK